MTKMIQLVGLPTDVNSSFLRGAAKGPELIRRALRSDMSHWETELGVEIDPDAVIEDMGDLPLTECADDDRLISEAVASAIRARRVPLCIGGDHAVTAPILRGIAEAHGPVSILHFDAHPDLYESFEGNPRSHASPFARIMEAGWARRLVQVGIRTLNRHQQEQAARYGVEIVHMRQFSVDAVPAFDGPLYVSIDLDSLDPAFAPGVSHHEPGGLSVRDILSVLHARGRNIVGADVVELNPDNDINGMTATVAAKLVKELCGLIVSR